MTVKRASRPAAARTVSGNSHQPAAPEHVEQLFFNRDDSWLRFNGRVLEEAQDESNPLLERVKFLAITASNLDEFIEIRVAGILQRIEDGYTEPGFDGRTPRQTLEVVV